jgi:hypothetical protein
MSLRDGAFAKPVSGKFSRTGLGHEQGQYRHRRFLNESSFVASIRLC